LLRFCEQRDAKTETEMILIPPNLDNLTGYDLANWMYCDKQSPKKSLLDGRYIVERLSPPNFVVCSCRNEQW